MSIMATIRRNKQRYEAVLEIPSTSQPEQSGWPVQWRVVQMFSSCSNVFMCDIYQI